MTVDEIPEEFADLIPGDTGEYEIISPDVSCANCAHRNICALYSGIAPMLADWPAGDGEPPIDLDDLAVICGEYLPDDEP
ncbi:MAG: hypothetical protein ACODAC_07285 [Pseudomonadota bacterium]